MHKLAVIMVVGLMAVLVVGCASPYPVGSIYTNLTLPVAVTSNPGPSPKTGTAECTSFLAMFATGDVSIEAAKKNGGITKVHHVDWHVENILGIIGKYKITVYGE